MPTERLLKIMISQKALAFKDYSVEKVPYFSSTKPYTGHTLAAAGSIEAVYCLLGLQHQMIWPNLNFQHQMPELSITPVQGINGRS